MNELIALTEDKWQAIIHSDADCDGQFFYAVRTTGIFCRPSCKSKPPKRENVTLFLSAEEAVLAKYRPCKRCRPTGRRLPDEEWVIFVAEYIDRHFSTPLSLAILAESCHGSPFHLQRTFKKIKGITPAEYIQRTRISAAEELLVTTDYSVSEVAKLTGFINTPYFITLFKKMTGCTPAVYRIKLHPDTRRGTAHDE